MVENNTKWFAGLEALRGLLFILIFLSHSGSFITSYGLWGGAAVSTFFIMGGFLSGYKYRYHDVNIFNECIFNLWKKIKKFYTLYFIMLLVAALGLNKGSLKVFVENLLLVQSWFGRESALSFNWISWFLSSIMFCYLIDPIINRLSNRIEDKEYKFLFVFVALLIGFECIFSYIWRGNAEPDSNGYYVLYLSPYARLIDYSIGIIVGKIYRNITVEINENTSTLFEGLALLIYIFILAIGDHIPYNIKATTIWAVPSIVIVILFANSNGRIAKWCASNNFLRYLGKRSFELFLIHRMVLVFFERFACSPISVLSSFIVSILAAETYRSMEKLVKEMIKIRKK